MEPIYLLNIRSGMGYKEGIIDYVYVYTRLCVKIMSQGYIFFFTMFIEEYISVLKRVPVQSLSGNLNDHLLIESKVRTTRSSGIYIFTVLP